MLLARFTSDDPARTARHVASVASAYMPQPSEEEVGELVAWLRNSLGLDEDEPTFLSALAIVARVVARNADRYGTHGNDSDAVIAGRSSMKYWLDHLGVSMLARLVREHAGLPPPVVVDVAAAPKSSARTCGGRCKTKLEPGELCVVVNEWAPCQDPSVLRLCVSERACCLTKSCVEQFGGQYKIRIKSHDARPGLHSPVLNEELSQAAKVSYVVRMAELASDEPTEEAKPAERFPGDRKKTFRAQANRREKDGESPWGNVIVNDDAVATAEDARRTVWEQGRLTAEAADAKRARDIKAMADAKRAEKYKPTMKKFINAPVDDASARCVYVFKPGGRCPYDKWTGATTPFCSMCHMMVEQARAALA